MTMLAQARLDRAVSNHIHRDTIVQRPQETFASGDAIMHTIAEKFLGPARHVANALQRGGQVAVFFSAKPAQAKAGVHASLSVWFEPAPCSVDPRYITAEPGAISAITISSGLGWRSPGHW